MRKSCAVFLLLVYPHAISNAYTADKNSIKHTIMSVLLFQTIAPGIPLPTQPVLNRWKTWLDAVYYAEYYGKIMEEQNERIQNLTGEQSDGITVFRIPPMTSLMLHRCRTGAINLQRTDNNLYSRHDSHRSFQQLCSLFRCNVTSLMPLYRCRSVSAKINPTSVVHYRRYVRFKFVEYGEVRYSPMFALQKEACHVCYSLL
ncbi:hypothetical protein ANN_26948 [Periplaneta americana]|uniref:Uncharacterized protein n=1 Tax=Periplaneta americana TaxID=6978 RepID=A0ABQ8RWV5_PERAM|nr:hypothetical protein ANN_26948 [Periplaneta americana]